MWDTIQKLRFRAGANILDAQEELNTRLGDRMELPLPGIHGERLFLTNVSGLRKRAAELTKIYESLPEHHGVQDTILLDAWSSATIEGARTTVAQVKRSLANPRTKDDRMVVNAMIASKYAYEHPITGKNIRMLWEMVADGVCENGLDCQHGGRGHTNCGPVGVSGDVFASGNLFNHVLLPPFLVMKQQKAPF